MKGNAQCRTAAVLWTGGKDSALALHAAEQQGYRVECLATFAPPNPRFLAHPIDFIQLQAQAMGRAHHVLSATDPYQHSYESGLRWLRDTKGIDCVVTGDIAEVNAQPNWMRQRGHAAGVEVLTPLWGRDRRELLQCMLALDFKIVLSLVKTASLDASWAGRELSHAAIDELAAVHAKNGLDLCGENGEYHTLVSNGPMFEQPIAIRAYSIGTVDAMAYMNIEHAELDRHACR